MCGRNTGVASEKNAVKSFDSMYYPAGGNEEWFGVGHVDAMFRYFDRHLAL